MVQTGQGTSPLLSKKFKYTYRPPAVDIPEVPRKAKSKPKENFTGQVQGKKASTLEERFARGLDKVGMSYEFRMRINPQMGLTPVIRNEVGEVEIDFLVYDRGIMYPVMIDGQIGHYFGAWQKERDEKKDTVVNESLAGRNASLVIRVKYDEILTEIDVDNYIKKLPFLAVMNMRTYGNQSKRYSTKRMGRRKSAG